MEQTQKVGSKGNKIWRLLDTKGDRREIPLWLRLWRSTCLTDFSIEGMTGLLDFDIAGVTPAAESG